MKINCWAFWELSIDVRREWNMDNYLSFQLIEYLTFRISSKFELELFTVEIQKALVNSRFIIIFLSDANKSSIRAKFINHPQSTI